MPQAVTLSFAYTGSFCAHKTRINHQAEQPSCDPDWKGMEKYSLDSGPR